MPKKKVWVKLRVPEGVSYVTFLNECPDLAKTAKTDTNYDTRNCYVLIHTAISIVELEKRMSELGKRCGTGR
jgi:hypothetical protein